MAKLLSSSMGDKGGTELNSVNIRRAFMGWVFSYLKRKSSVFCLAIVQQALEEIKDPLPHRRLQRLDHIWNMQ